MFTRQLFVATVLLVTIGSAYSIQKATSKVAPMSSSDAKLKTCEVHHTSLKTGTATITYGIVSGFPAGYYQASGSKFPHAKSRISAGCVVPPNAPQEQAVKFCPQCRATEKKWFDAHKTATSRR